MEQLQKLGKSNAPPSPKQTRTVTIDDYNRLVDIINSLISGSATTYQSPVVTATKTLVADGGTDETTTIASSEFSDAITSAPKLIQVYTSAGVLITGLDISYTLNGAVYDVIIGGDIDGHTNAIINVIF